MGRSDVAQSIGEEARYQGECHSPLQVGGCTFGSGNPEPGLKMYFPMPYHPDFHHRRSIRLRNYDYAKAGTYFVTLCTYQRQCLFGHIVDGKMTLNEIGKIVEAEWLRSPEIRNEISLDYWVVMPNHFHGIVIITHDDNPQESLSPHSSNPNQSSSQDWSIRMKPRSLSSLITGFKSATTRQINHFRNAAGTPVWQRNYYDNIVHDQQSLENFRQYIKKNPSSWQVDQLHPQNPSKW
jgi:putative transposase